jgi:hypothetical protein
MTRACQKLQFRERAHQRNEVKRAETIGILFD